ncbi:MAG: DNA mismatch repair protein MutS [Candidatus Wallbacteria bacterium]|nr:DNA mismatch repair protein MutS [Candidatus Wallbacteria bacterium]
MAMVTAGEGSGPGRAVAPAIGAKLTPLMEQYHRIKGQHRDCILFFRMGDFYEMFYDDAVTAARELEIVLTARGKDGGEPVPLAGIPYHAYKSYAARLLKKGFKVAICEQVSDPKLTKGIVERQVTNVLTPGTLLDESFLGETGGHNYLVALTCGAEHWGLAQADYSTGDLAATTARDPERLYEEVLRLAPAEVLADTSLSGSPFVARLARALALPAGALNFRPFPMPVGPDAAAALADSALAAISGYIAETQGRAAGHMKPPELYRLEEFLALDPATIRNLELVANMRSGEVAGSLLWALDRTATPMGRRLLREWVQHPLLDLSGIAARQRRVGALVESVHCRKELRSKLRGVADIPRLLARVASRQAGPRDLVALRRSLEAFPELKALMEESGLSDLSSRIGDFSALAAELARWLVDEPPLELSEGGVIRPGVDERLDHLRELFTGAKSYLARLEEAERQRTGIKSLKIRYNRVMGYYIEITRTNLESVPEDYRRKQTLSNGERFVTEELKRKEEEILTAEDKAASLEYELFCRLRDGLDEHRTRLQQAAGALAELDVYAGLAEVAELYRYVRPEFIEAPELTIEDGRHPVVERVLTGEPFVPNSVALVPEQSQTIILTGPNMAGKSTYLRQVALLVVMAQLGSYVPARSMRLGVVDKVFTRVGASDNLVFGESTFMVEMKETAYILQNATPRSLVILDEVGRGTATYDGLSLAWAIVEYLHTTPELAPKTLFATHYHELTELANLLPGVVNGCVMVEEVGEDIVFLHRIATGAADKSYGIQVARLAGLPAPVIERSKTILFELSVDEERDIERKRLAMSSKKKKAAEEDGQQLRLFVQDPSPVVEELRRLDVDRLTPLDALNLLARYKSMV